MAGIVNIPKFVDFRDKVKRHKTRKFPVLNLKGKTTIAIHHSLTKQGLGGSNAEGYARYHVDTHGWPSIGYSYVIEPDGTVKFCNDIELRTYHVGNHNNYAVGICLTGDFRTEDPTDEQKESLRNLVNALQEKYTHLKHIKGHNEFSGYEWKKCPMFDYKAVLNQDGKKSESRPAPDTYKIQEGDTFWSIAKGFDGLTVTDLEKANPDVEPTELQIGQVINLNTAKSKATEKDKKSVNYKGNSIVDYLNLIGEDSSFGNRAALATKNGINNYKGTESQNIKLLGILRDGKKSKQPSKASSPKPKNDTQSFSVGSKVTIKQSAKTYATGETIPNRFKGKTYTVQQEKSNQVLIKELFS